MKNTEGDGHRPACMMAHRFINKLTMIIGSCDILLDSEDHAESDCRRRMTKVREIAQDMADDLIDHQCELDEVTRMRTSREEVLVVSAKHKR
jgi:hypothetical protein